MQICKRTLTSAGIIFFGFFSSWVFCQSMPKMPDFPEITAPKIGDGFYTPEIPYFPNQKSVNKNQEQSETTSLPAATISDSTSTTELLSNYLNTSNMLTASDITSLSNAGSFSDLTSLYNIGNLTGQNDTSTTILLQQILTSLEDLKKNQNTTVANNSTVSNNTTAQNKPSVLRFKINGYDIKDSLTTVYFSNREHDGSFLLTADRRYVADKKVRTETFYLLFKTQETSGSMITYEVSPSIVQDNKNENSFIYKLASQKNLTATKTGNLVILKTNSKDCTTDLLLDLNE